MKEQKIMWWGYVHKNGKIQVKRVWEDAYSGDIEDAKRSPFVIKVIKKFEAENRDDAIKKIIKKLKGGKK